MTDGGLPVERSDRCDESCPLGHAIARRDFLRDAVASALLAIGALGAGSTRASALSVAFTSGAGARADKTYPIPTTDGAVIDRDESVIIARAGEKVYAFSLACPHQNTALRWDGRNGRFQCPKHRSRYRPDGGFIDGRATRGMDRFAVRLDGTMLSVNLDALYREDENAAQWAAAFVTLNEK